MSDTPALLKKNLKDHFGYDHFRPNQEEIITSVLSGDDTIAIMPTGGGKSICFQLPAIILPKLTLVISPLIALMKDQVDSLQANGIAAEYLNSTISDQQTKSITARIQSGQLKLLYIAPESLQYIDHFLSENFISMIAIDEAHCISSWGHDFRPAYTKLGYLKQSMPNIPIIALTATADKPTREDIASQLHIPKANRFISSFDRPNLYLEVKPGQDRLKHILKFINNRKNECGIIYCLSRKSTEGIAEKLKKQGIRAAAYHAGMPADKRSKIQEDFINDNVDVMCATIAFGMGIDKSNVRWVIHYNLPKNIEGYYQEIGRAGRDGVNSDTLLFYSYSDVMQLRKFAKGSSNEDYQLAKLERMQQYSESLNCRRQALLSYFGEALENDCGFCDNCKNPPEIIDGTVIAQKALSAVYRLEGSEPINNLVDFIRGSNNAYIQSKGLSKLRTYGVGSEIAWKDWQSYIIQMLNQGLVEIAFHQNNRIKLTPLSHKVLFEKRPVKLARNVEVDYTPTKVKGKKAPKNYVADDLFEALRTLRSALAKEQGVPPYIIFSDASLKNMAADKPKNFSDFLDIEGVGQAKLEKFGEVFLSVINNFELAQEKKKKPAKKSTKGNTHLVTYDLFKSGKTREEIAIERNLSDNTILNHLVELYATGKDIDLMAFTTIDHLSKVKSIQQSADKSTLKSIFVACEESINYDEIKVCLAILEGKKKGA